MTDVRNIEPEMGIVISIELIIVNDATMKNLIRSERLTGAALRPRLDHIVGVVSGGVSRHALWSRTES